VVPQALAAKGNATAGLKTVTKDMQARRRRPSRRTIRRSLFRRRAVVDTSATADALVLRLRRRARGADYVASFERTGGAGVSPCVVRAHAVCVSVGRVSHVGRDDAQTWRADYKGGDKPAPGPKVPKAPVVKPSTIIKGPPKVRRPLVSRAPFWGFSGPPVSFRLGAVAWVRTTCQSAARRARAARVSKTSRSRPKENDPLASRRLESGA
jgi:hypothetical protein